MIRYACLRVKVAKGHHCFYPNGTRDNGPEVSERACVPLLSDAPPYIRTRRTSHIGHGSLPVRYRVSLYFKWYIHLYACTCMLCV